MRFTFFAIIKKKNLAKSQVLYVITKYIEIAIRSGVQH